MTASHSASVMLASIRSRRMPALLTRTSRPPKVSIACCTSRSAPSQSRDVVAVGDGLAAHGLDLGDDVVRRAGRSVPAPSMLAAEVVDDDLGAVGGEHQRVLAADAAAGAGDDAHPSLAQLAHLTPLSSSTGASHHCRPSSKPSQPGGDADGRATDVPRWSDAPPQAAHPPGCRDPDRGRRDPARRLGDRHRRVGRRGRRATSQLAGRDVGGMHEDRARGAVVREVAEPTTRRHPVEIRTTGHTYETTAGELGLSVDEPATVEAALDVGRTESVPLRPLDWVASFVAPARRRRCASRSTTTRSARCSSRSRATTAASRSSRRSCASRRHGRHRRRAAAASRIDAEDGRRALLRRRPTTAGDRLIASAPSRSSSRRPSATTPPGALADELTAKTAEPLVGRAPEQVAAEIPPRPCGAGSARSPGTDGLEVTARRGEGRRRPRRVARRARARRPNDAVDHARTRRARSSPRARPAPAAAPPAPPPRVLDGHRRPDSRDRASRSSSRRARPFTTEEAEELGIKEPVGTTAEWKGVQQVKSLHDLPRLLARPGSRTSTASPTSCAARSSRRASTFSVNDYVGPAHQREGLRRAPAPSPTASTSEEVGGGVSQFATTLFNAAFFAGLDIGEYQATRCYFDRYPRGREATMGFPHPDLADREQHAVRRPDLDRATPDTSLTVTLYSTPVRLRRSRPARPTRRRATAPRVDDHPHPHLRRRPAPDHRRGARAVYRPDDGVSAD